MKTLVLGKGLLGRAMCRVAPETKGVVDPIPWSDERAATMRLERSVREFVEGAQGRWSIAWCAGAGVVGTNAESLALERRHMATVLRAIGNSSRRSSHTGSVFIASSAGGVFGAGSAEYLSESTPISPTSAYGGHKAQQESDAAAWARDHDVTVLIGRISNLYGSDQNLQKQQGFLSHVFRSMLTKTPFTLTVPADTLRDLIHVDDAAKRIAAWLRASSSSDVNCSIKLIVSGRSTSMQHIINTAKSVSGIRPRMLYAANATSAMQPHYLRFRSDVLSYIDVQYPARSLEVGAKHTWNRMLAAYSRGEIT